jgi:hypothetical protein
MTMLVLLVPVKLNLDVVFYLRQHRASQCRKMSPGDALSLLLC